MSQFLSFPTVHQLSMCKQESYRFDKLNATKNLIRKNAKIRFHVVSLIMVTRICSQLYLRLFLSVFSIRLSLKQSYSGARMLFYACQFNFFDCVRAKPLIQCLHRKDIGAQQLDQRHQLCKLNGTHVANTDIRRNILKLMKNR